MTPVIEELFRVPQVMFIIGPLFPFHIFCFISGHGQLHAVVFNIGNSAIGNVAVFGKEVALMYEKRIFIDLCDVAYVLVIRRVDMHVWMKVVLAPVWHVLLSLSVTVLCLFDKRLVTTKSFMTRYYITLRLSRYPQLGQFSEY